MAEIQVTAAQLKEKASTLREFNSQFKSKLGELEGQEGGLLSMWDGEAKEAFDRAFKNDKAQMDNFANLIEEYCAALDMEASRYEMAEARNTSTASTRSY